MTDLEKIAAIDNELKDLRIKREPFYKKMNLIDPKQKIKRAKNNLQSICVVVVFLGWMAWGISYYHMAWNWGRIFSLAILAVYPGMFVYFFILLILDSSFDWFIDKVLKYPKKNAEYDALEERDKQLYKTIQELESQRSDLKKAIQKEEARQNRIANKNITKAPQVKPTSTPESRNQITTPTQDSLIGPTTKTDASDIKKNPPEPLPQKVELPTPVQKNEPLQKENPSPIVSKGKLATGKEPERIIVKPQLIKEEKQPEIQNADAKVLSLSEIFKPVQKTIMPIDKTKTTKIITAEEYLESSKKKIELGLAGELFVLKLEKDKLKKAGQGDLVERVSHISIEQGDSAGYDILSYDEKGMPAYIEVKTTEGESTTDFFVTNNEMKHLKSKSNYWIYRVCNYNFVTEQGNYYVIKSEKDLESYFDLEPVSFRISPKRKT